MINGKAKLVADNFCDGLGACLGECPTGALQIIEREAEDFDEEAVENPFMTQKREAATQAAPPDARRRSTIFYPPLRMRRRRSTPESVPSSLEHWPVQIHLVPATAPFFKGADLFVAADCVPVTFPPCTWAFLKGKVVMVGCPEFDDVQEYIDKFADVFTKAGIKSVTTVIMEGSMLLGPSCDCEKRDGKSRG